MQIQSSFVLVNIRYHFQSHKQKYEDLRAIPASDVRRMGGRGEAQHKKTNREVDF